MQSDELTTTSTALNARIMERAEAIEAELKRAGYWATRPPAAEAMRFAKPYAADTMPFPQWLQFVFLPRVRDLLGAGQTFPRGSAIGAHAEEVMGRDPNAARLIGTLRAFDALLTPDGSGAADDDDPIAAAKAAVAEAEADAADRRRLGPGVWAVAWTVAAIVFGGIFAMVVPRLMPGVRQEYVSFSAAGPLSRAYDLVAFTVMREGPAGAPRRQELRAAITRGGQTMSSTGLSVDLGTHGYAYPDDAGHAVMGDLTPDAVLAWMKRNGVADADESDRRLLSDEAAEMVRAAEASKSDAALDALLKPAAAGGATRPATTNLEWSPARTLVRDKPGETPRWLRYGVPVGAWAVGLLVILLIGRRRRAAAGAMPSNIPAGVARS